MDQVLHFFHQAAFGLGYVAVGLLCVAGLLLSCISFSGTWLVVVATIVAAVLSGPEFPGWGLILLYVALSVLVEVAEAGAGMWGVRKRGGTGWAGFAALIGGLVGLFLGSFIPVPLVGSLIGMLVCSFALVYAVERRRLQQSQKAAHIAWGAVTARVLMIFLKVGTTLGMAVGLALGMIFKD